MSTSALNMLSVELAPRPLGCDILYFIPHSTIRVDPFLTLAATRPALLGSATVLVAKVEPAGGV